MKDFSTYGLENFENNAYPGYDLRPGMMDRGRDAAAKKTVGELLSEPGWEPLKVGDLEQALHLEHMTLLWIRTVRMNGHTQTQGRFTPRSGHGTYILYSGCHQLSGRRGRIGFPPACQSEP